MYRDYVRPLANTMIELYKFNARSQKEKEGIDRYVTELRQLVTRCDFEHITPEEILRDRVILGITDIKLRTRLLRDANITLEKTLQICRASELSEQNSKSMDGGKEVNFVKAKRGSQKMKYAESKKDAFQHKDYGGRCKYCDGKHPLRNVMHVEGNVVNITV